MNISTGGPHILIFERDQQLAGLFISEFQLAGYECHTARTAVEVFDAIARQPIRLVLVNLAQAAAARREFWVALDTQRRGRGVQVLTFRCTNIAGYGPHDPDERSQAMADIEIDGMLGIVNLVDTVRARIPGTTGATTNTIPRLPRTVTPPPPSQVQSHSQRIVHTPNNMLSASGTSSRPPSQVENLQSSLRTSSPAFSQPAPPPAPPVHTPMAPPPFQEAQPSQPGAFSSNQSTYTDKIRAVLYPNQRTWAPQGSNTIPAVQESRNAFDAHPMNAAPPEATTLQRLANGQTGTQAGTDPAKESGLAQLSRMLQQRQAEEPNPNFSTSSSYAMPEAMQTEMPQYPIPNPPATQASAATGSVNYTMSPSRPTQPAENGPISTQPLRASPIQDMPTERNTGNQNGSESARRPDVLSRTNYGQQPATPAPLPSLASITTPAPAPAPVTMPEPIPMPAPAPTKPPVEEEYIVEEIEKPTARQVIEELARKELNKGQYTIQTQIHEELAHPQEHGADGDSSMTPDNAMLLDIVQSLPPMPPPTTQPPQPLQPSVLNGRATRTLGRVLLEGHLVPQNRLEVAQHIQRMLRGVDLNYQLGEILLMFKLLSPDQLLAASLVSYGLITTTQISALGRIRQELHSIGLEYDLENLLILFRILTPEQLREVKTSWQG